MPKQLNANAAHPFRTLYAREGTPLVRAETDALHGTLPGQATAVPLRRAIECFENVRYVRLAEISNGHLYNVRRSRTYARVPGSHYTTSQR